MTYHLIKVRRDQLVCGIWHTSAPIRHIDGSDGLLWGLVYGQLSLAGKYQP